MADNPDSHREIPDAKTLSEAGDLQIQDETGAKIPFKTLYTDKPSSEQHLIIFIRHFFCGVSPFPPQSTLPSLPLTLNLQTCEFYLHDLAKSLPQESLTATSTNVTIIGCGAANLISDYRTRNALPFPVYADPERKVYAKLGMRISASPTKEGYLAKQPEYTDKGFFSIVFSSMWTAIASGHKALGGGPPGQNGGAVLVKGGQCVFVYRMRTVTDYTKAGELKEVLGVKE